MTARVAIYGGSFNPPHVGHVLAAAYALAVAPVDRVLVVPTFIHPFAKELASFEDRLAMCELAMGELPGVSISRVEAELGGESLTLRTLEHLTRTEPAWALRLLIGSDILADAPKWHGFAQVSALAPLLVLGRAGFAADAAPRALLPEVSSTQIRALLGAGRYDEAAPLVPSRVLDYIRERGLYLSKAV